MSAEKIFINGHILTMDPDLPLVSAFAVSGGRFLAVGSSDWVMRQAGKDAQIFDLEGKTVVPGFIETHSHLSLHAMIGLQADCKTPPNRTIGDVKDRLRRQAVGCAPGQWIKGWGYDDTLIMEKRHLCREDLDEAVTDHPVFVSHASGHLAYVNSRALEIAGIDNSTPQPDGGLIEKDGTGRPTGLLKEDPAQNLVTRYIPNYTTSELKKAMIEGLRYFHRHGITSAHDAAIGYFRHEQQIIQAYRELQQEGKLTMRIYLTIVERVYQKLLKAGFGTGFGCAFLKLGAVKLFQDGSIQALTAALHEPYFCQPSNCGDLIHEQEELEALIERYHRAGVQVAVHANGDRAISSVLQAIERALVKYPNRDHRHMLIHAQLATRDQIEWMKRLGVVPSYFVNHVYYWGDRHLKLFLGRSRAERIDPLGSTVRSKVPFTLHSDTPVTPVSPLFSMHYAVNRRTQEGVLLGECERINVADALRAYTSFAAHCSYEESLKGSISSGKYADFTVLAADPFQVDPEEICNIEVLQTHVDGHCVFSR